VFSFDRKISVGESSDFDRDAKGVLAVPLNIVGGLLGTEPSTPPSWSEHGEHPVEADVER
jgi:hypothetical protein